MRGDCFVLALFFSKSGLAFAKARGEKIPVALTPLTDSVWEWGSIFASIRPNITAIMRHEIWPGFLTTACDYSHVCLIDASTSFGERKSRLKRIIRRRLLNKFHNIFAVSREDLDFFSETYLFPIDRLHLVGDTKYDRVIERAMAKKDGLSQLKSLLDRSGQPLYRLIVGSAHKADIENVIAAYKQLGSDKARWQVVLVPHHVDTETIAWVQKELDLSSVSWKLFSQLHDPNHGLKQELTPFIIVNQMGLLAELYATGHAALVGGAFHHQVHNVLEPACHGLALAWGPRFENSQEAISIVQLGLADVLENSSQLAAWWRELPGHLAQKTRGVTEAVANLCGASDKIMAKWQTVLGSN
jgi:3-deoxy-D-manno-octulosonic-acid transferase